MLMPTVPTVVMASMMVVMLILIMVSMFFRAYMLMFWVIHVAMIMVTVGWVFIVILHF